MNRGIRFLLDGAVQTLTDADPTMTILQLLREHIGRTGTKEGCAEGDCGACTVAVTAIENGHAITRAVNSCIAFVPTLDGKALTTVESMGGPDAPHPIQQAMVDAHASQCGFCTPGFVMTLFARGAGAPGTQGPLEDTLAGNLCRCTGYGPILAAGRMLSPDPIAIPADTIRLLMDLQSVDALDMTFDCPVSGVRKRWFAPRTVDDLARLYQTLPDAVIVAGATDVGLWVTKRGRTLETIISIAEIEELRRIGETPNAIEIGAGVRYTDVHDILARAYPDMGEVFRRIGAVQVRSAGTIGGNIANGSPIGDTLPLLIAAGATLHLRKGDAARSLPLENYFLSYGHQDRTPGEFVSGVTVPKPKAGRHFKAYKISKRLDQDISAVCGAFAFEIERGTILRPRIAFGGMAETPKRAAHVEAALSGAPATETGIAPAVAAFERDFTPISDMRASAGYRMQVAKNLLRKCVLEATGADPLRLAGAGTAAHA